MAINWFTTTVNLYVAIYVLEHNSCNSIVYTFFIFIEYLRNTGYDQRINKQRELVFAKLHIYLLHYNTSLFST